MSQPNPYGHRQSVPINFHQPYGKNSGQGQQRSFSTSHASFSNDPTASLVSGGGSQWRDGHGYPSNSQDAMWQQDQYQQYAQTQETLQQTDSIPNILGDVQNVIQSRSLNEGPLFLYGAQQPSLPFDSEQFQQSGSRALTAIPDTRSQKQSLVDSGYGSQFMQKEPALADDTSEQTSEKFLSPAHVSPQRPRARRGPRSVASDGVLHGPARVEKSARTLHRCPRKGCDKAGIKNQSDLRKHLNAHDKPFTCEVPGCEKHEDGFGTSNDLERHRASVHGLAQRCGTTAGFICFACEQNRPGNYKWWPRKDNFVSHIKRKHPEWNIDALVERSRFASRPQDIELRSATSHHGHEEDQLQHDSFETINESYNFPLGGGTDGDIVAEGGQWASGESAAHDMLAGSMGMTNNMMRGHSFHGRTAPTGSNFELSPTDSVFQSTMPTPTFRVTDMGQNSHAQNLDMSNWHRMSMTSQMTPSNSQASNSCNGFQCPECPRWAKRACDLRKHQKRHSRPYGCTFPSCFKRFGSRNDWKRHENSQHLILEQWRCQVPNHDGSACARLFAKKFDMAAHLDSRHGNEGYHHDQPMHSVAIKQAHLGHEGHHQFWCGFCNTLIPQHGDVHTANWDNRFQHIGDHFDKDKRTIDDWVDIEQNLKKRLLIRPKSAKRSANKDSDSGDESDLGDDGIPTDQSAADVFVAPGNAAPMAGSAGYGTDLRGRGGLYAMDKRMDMTGDQDAEGEVDQQFMMMQGVMP